MHVGEGPSVATADRLRSDLGRGIGSAAVRLGQGRTMAPIWEYYHKVHGTCIHINIPTLHIIKYIIAKLHRAVWRVCRTDAERPDGLHAIVAQENAPKGKVAGAANCGLRCRRHHPGGGLRLCTDGLLFPSVVLSSRRTPQGQLWHLPPDARRPGSCDTWAPACAPPWLGG